MSIWNYSDRLAPVPPEHRMTLGEGGTPWVRSRRIGPAAGIEHLYFKLETGNPTGSYKDRFAAAAISHMRARGQRRCIATSSGNAGAALAAYCAAAGMECHIAVVETAPEGKLRQMLAYGAKIFRIRQFGLDADISARTFSELQRIGARDDSDVQISAFAVSPEGMTGVQTIAHELIDQTDQPIDHLFAPAGGGGLCLALARGFRQCVEHDQIARSPAVEVVQPVGNDTIATPLRQGDEQARAVTATTQISGLQVPSVIDGHMTLSECRATGGSGHAVSDELIWEAQRRLAREEGIFCEPAAATALAGALQASREGRLSPQARVVCLVTGSGFKDDNSITRMIAGTECPMWDLADLQQME